MAVEWPVYFKDRLIVGDFDSCVGIATLWMPKESIADVLAEFSTRTARSNKNTQHGSNKNTQHGSNKNTQHGSNKNTQHGSNKNTQHGSNNNSSSSNRAVGEGVEKVPFAVCGQLYTKRGINPLLRNILANPKIRHLVVCGPDRQGSGDALFKFFKNGIASGSAVPGNDSGWRIIGDDEALIDKEIPLEALELVRRSVSVHNKTGCKVEEVRDFVQKLPTKEPFAQPQIFAEDKAVSQTSFPSDTSVFKVRRELVGEAWLDVLKTIIRFGIDTPGMYGRVKQVHNLAVVIEKENTESPKLPNFLGFNQKSLDSYYQGFFSQNQDQDEAYTYGERIFNWGAGINQREIMARKLKQFPYDRGAVAVLWEPQTDNFSPKTGSWKVPCLVMLLAQCLGENLHLTAVFRNNDMFGAWPLNAFALRRFQEELAASIDKRVGSLTTVSHIAEIYESDWGAAGKIVTQNDSLDRTCVYDPRGYYIVKVEGANITADFFSPDGANLLATLAIDGKKPKCARDLCAMAVKEMLISDLGAACDLGRQLAKAETAVKLGLKFEQDKPLHF